MPRTTIRDGDLGEEWLALDVDALLEPLRADGQPLDPACSKEMLAKMGRNLLMFNVIESGLKKVLPYMHPRGGAKGADGFEALKSELELLPLGLVAKALRESLKTNEASSFDAYLRAVIVHRNNLMHHFFSQQGVDMSPEGMRVAIKWLDEQYSFCFALQELTGTFLVIALHALESAGNKAE